MFCKNAALFGRLIVEPCWRVQDKPRRRTNLPPLHILHNKHHQGPDGKTFSSPHVWPAATDSPVLFRKGKAEERAGTKRRETARMQTQKKKKNKRREVRRTGGTVNQRASRLDSLSKFTAMFWRKSTVGVDTFKRQWIADGGSAAENNGGDTQALITARCSRTKHWPPLQNSAEQLLFQFLACWSSPPLVCVWRKCKFHKSRTQGRAARHGGKNSCKVPLF